MEASTKKVGIVAAALAAFGAVTFAVGRLFAKPTGGEPFVLKMMKTVGYRPLPVAVPDMPMVEPDPTSKGPRLIDWAAAEQKKGRAVMVPSIYYQGMTTGSPSQIVSIDPRMEPALSVLGTFKKLSTI